MPTISIAADKKLVDIVDESIEKDLIPFSNRKQFTDAALREALKSHKVYGA